MFRIYQNFIGLMFIFFLNSVNVLFCREGGKKLEVYYDKSCFQFKLWCEGYLNFEVVRAALEAGFVGEKKEVILSTFINFVKDIISLQLDIVSLCSCVISQGEGGMLVISFFVVKDNGQFKFFGVSYMIGREGLGDNCGDFQVVFDYEFGEFVFFEFDL